MWKLGSTLDHNKQVITDDKPPQLVATFLDTADAKAAVAALKFVAEFLDWAANHDTGWRWRKYPDEILADDEGWQGLLEDARSICPQEDSYPHPQPRSV